MIIEVECYPREQMPCFLADNLNILIPLNELRCCHCLQQKTLTLRPCLLLDLGKRSIDSQYCAPLPLLFRLNGHAVAQNGLEDAVDDECFGSMLRCPFSSEPHP